MKIFVGFAVVFVSLYLCGQSLPIVEVDANWSTIDNILQDAIVEQAFPGCVALVGSRKGILYVNAFGSFTYGIPPPNNQHNPPMTVDVIAV
jgi:hypothetical protein